jgi:ribose-phosphate pyrophosphokinase
MVDALKRASAKRITVVAPCTVRTAGQEDLGREPISARLIAVCTGRPAPTAS